jgi:hypothetical protein
MAASIDPIATVSQEKPLELHSRRMLSLAIRSVGLALCVELNKGTCNTRIAAAEIRAISECHSDRIIMEVSRLQRLFACLVMGPLK